MLRRCRTCPSSLTLPNGDNVTDDRIITNLIDELTEVYKEKRISFAIDVRFQSAVQQQDNQELDRILTEYDRCYLKGKGTDVNGNRINDIQDLDLDMANPSGLSALHQAVLNNNLDSVKLLLSHGANPNVRDAYGYTPLHAAAACGARNIACLLIIFGGDLFNQTTEGDLAVDLSKDPVTADLYVSEMCRQIQQKDIMEHYGFVFALIDSINFVCSTAKSTFNFCYKWSKKFVSYYKTEQDAVS